MPNWEKSSKMRLLCQRPQLTLVVVEAVLTLHLEGVLAVDARPAGGARTAASEG